MASNEIIKVQHLCKNYDTGHDVVKALQDVNLTITSGEFMAIMGSSGSGKSTFLNILGCLDSPSSGD